MIFNEMMGCDWETAGYCETGGKAIVKQKIMGEHQSQEFDQRSDPVM